MKTLCLLSVGVVFVVGSAQAATLRTQTIKAASGVSLTGKKKYDRTKMAASISYRGTVPLITLGGSTLALEPTGESPPAVSLVASSIAGILATSACRSMRTDRSSSVDHRSRQSSIKDQGSRGTCVSHASMAALESWFNWKLPTDTSVANQDFAEQHAHHVSMLATAGTCEANTGVTTYKAATYLTDAHVCKEAKAPYTSTVPSDTSSHIDTSCTRAARYGFKSTQVFLGKDYGGEGSCTANSTAYLEGLLDAGNDLVMGVYVAGTDWSDGTAESGVIDVQVDSTGNPAEATGGHAMLAVGYNHDSKYFIFKNSWKSSRGHSGYFYLSYDYIKTYAKYGYYIVEAESSVGAIVKVTSPQVVVNPTSNSAVVKAVGK